MDPNSAKVLPRSSKRTYRKRKADNVGQSSKDIPTNVSSAAATRTEDGNDTSIWDDNLRIGDFIDKHFITEKDREAFEAWGIEKCIHVLKAAVVEEVSIVRFMEQKVGDLLKKNKAYEEENTDLKKDFEEVILKTSQLVESEEGLMEENAKMKAEIEDLKAKMEELRNEIILQYKVGFHEAIKQVLGSVFKLQS